MSTSAVRDVTCYVCRHPSPGVTWRHLASPDVTWRHRTSPGVTGRHLASPGVTWRHLASPAHYSGVSPLSAEPGHLTVFFYPQVGRGGGGVGGGGSGLVRPAGRRDRSKREPLSSVHAWPTFLYRHRIRCRPLMSLIFLYVCVLHDFCLRSSIFRWRGVWQVSLFSHVCK